MAEIKNPFGYLNETDYARIEYWLSNPNPDIDSAVEILGISRAELLETLAQVGISLELSEVASQTKSFSRGVYELKGSRRSPLNLILEPLYVYFSDQLDSGAIRLQTRRGRTHLFSSGTPEYREAKITLQYEKLRTDVVLEIERLIESAERRGVDVSVKKYE
jgi:hypothetical protein